MNIDKMRDRLRFRSWHRGTKEMDLLLGSFADKHLHALTPDQLLIYQEILEIGDPDFYDWITGQKPVPHENQSDVMDKIIAHRFVVT